MGPEPVGDDEPAPVNADSHTEAVSHADRGVRGVVGERFGKPGTQLSVIVCRGEWCRK
jgi:hypothetical protein